jgi:hypothetical protein
MTVVPTRPDEHPATRTVRFGRRSSRGVLLGLSAPRLAAVAAAFIVVLPAVYAGGMQGVVVTSPLWCAVLASAFVTVGGRRAVEWTPIYGHWLARRATGQNAYGVRVLKPRPAGSLALPGDAASLRLHHDAELRAAMVHDPYNDTLTAIARVRHPSFVLLSPSDQERRVAGWGRFFATCCQSGRLARVQVLERTLPDSGHGVLDWWRQRGRRDESWVALTYSELVAEAGPSSERHETTISIALDMAKTRRAIRHEGGGLAGAAAVLRQELSTVTAALRSAEIALDSWLEPSELAVMLRSAYDPAVTTRLDDTTVGRDPSTAGPVAVHEHVDHLATDSGLHVVLWISEWPRTEVYPSFLSPILLTAGVRRSLSIVAQPLTNAEAMRSVRKQRVEYQTDAAQRDKLGQLADFAAEQEWADVTQRERDLVAGHGDLRFAGFLTITASTIDGLRADQAAVEQAAIQAGCETRLLRGQQAQAFVAAALPLCRGI